MPGYEATMYHGMPGYTRLLRTMVCLGTRLQCTMVCLGARGYYVPWYAWVRCYHVPWYDKVWVLASHIQSTCNLLENVIVSLEYPQASSTLNVPYSGRRREYLDSADMCNFETILKSEVHAVHYTCYSSKILKFKQEQT